MIVERLVAARPAHAAFGEEHGLVGDPESPWRWVIDPIDGTSGFVRGIPVWATLIALTHADDGAVLGVVSAPALGRRWWGGVDLGAHVSAYGSTRSIRVSNVVDLAEAQVSITHSSGWEALGLDAAPWSNSNRPPAAPVASATSGSTCSSPKAPWTSPSMPSASPRTTWPPIMPIVEAAGGAFTDRHGEPTFEHDTAVSSNGLLHPDVIVLLDT